MKGFEIGGIEVALGSRATVNLEVSTLANASRMNLPVHVVHGAVAGPTLFLSGVVHGDEILGLEIIRRVLANDIVKTLRGTYWLFPSSMVLGFSTTRAICPIDAISTAPFRDRTKAHCQACWQTCSFGKL